MSYLWWMILGLLFGIVLCIVLLIITTKNGTLKRDYDERQQMVRGKGARYGFFTVMGCNGLFILWDIGVKDIAMELSVAMIISVLVGIIVYVSYCIWNEGYFSMNEKPKSLVWVFIVLAFVNLGIFFQACKAGEAIKNGVLTFRTMNLFCAIMMVIVLIVLLCKMISKKKED